MTKLALPPSLTLYDLEQDPGSVGRFVIGLPQPSCSGVVERFQREMSK